MPQIVPSILEEDIDRFNLKLAAVLKIPDVQRIQIDFSDGKFTPHLTLMPAEISLLNPAYKWEAHLMVQEPQAHFFDLKVAGFNNVIVHFEAAGSKNVAAIVAELAKFNMTCGLAINPETEPEKAAEHEQLLEQILVMGIHPGYQGRELLPQTAGRIKKLRKTAENVIIEVDGGVKIDNISELAAAGADRIVEGSALFDPGNEKRTPAENFQLLAVKAAQKET